MQNALDFQPKSASTGAKAILKNPSLMLPKASPPNPMTRRPGKSSPCQENVGLNSNECKVRPDSFAKQNPRDGPTSVPRNCHPVVRLQPMHTGRIINRNWRLPPLVASRPFKPARRLTRDPHHQKRIPHKRLLNVHLNFFPRRRKWLCKP